MIFIHCIPRKQNEKSFNYLYHINYNIIKSSIPPLFSQDSRISKECNPSTTWSNPAMEKNTYTPGGESRYTPLSKFNRLEKRRRVYRNYGLIDGHIDSRWPRDI